LNIIIDHAVKSVHIQAFSFIVKFDAANTTIAPDWPVPLSPIGRYIPLSNVSKSLPVLERERKGRQIFELIFCGKK